MKNERTQKKIEGMQILAKYDGCDIAAEHDIIYIGPEHNDVISEEDKKRLNELGFFLDEETDSWACFV